MTVDIQIKEFNGFVKSYWIKKEDRYWNHHMGSARLELQRVHGRHKNKRYMFGSRLKQFDTRHYRIVKHLKSRTCIPFRFMMFNISWRFGRGNHLSTKFSY